MTDRRAAALQKAQVLALLQERQEKGITQQDFDGSGHFADGTKLRRVVQVSRSISNLRIYDGHQIVKWRPPGQGWHWALKEYAKKVPQPTIDCGEEGHKAALRNQKRLGYGARVTAMRKAAKAANGDYGKWNRVRLRVVELVQMLQQIEPMIFWEEAPEWEAQQVFDDLVALRVWSERAIGAASARLDNDALSQKIAKLRNTHGRTPEEADTARRLADKLEGQRANRL